MFIRTSINEHKEIPPPKATTRKLKVRPRAHQARLACPQPPKRKSAYRFRSRGLYGVTTKALNQAVKRNLDRFPEDFMFQLTAAEHVQLNRSQIVTGSQRHRDPRNLPYAFTEQGVAMLSSVLRSPRAVEVNIAIMRTFVQLRRLMDSNQLLAEKIENLEQKYAEHDQNFTLVFDAIKQLITADSTPNKKMGFHAVP